MNDTHLTIRPFGNPKTNGGGQRSLSEWRFPLLPLLLIGAADLGCAYLFGEGDEALVADLPLFVGVTATEYTTTAS